MSSFLPADCVTDAFIAAPPALQSTILDLSIRQPSWMMDTYKVSPWPSDTGSSLQHLIYRGSFPQFERNFDKWAKQSDNSGCNPCEGPNCAYNVTVLGGSGLERKETTLMSREFRSEDYCINEISTTLQFKEVFAQIVKNLNSQIRFEKEINIGQNALVGIAKKLVVDSDGFKPNLSNPYMYPAIGSAKISTLNIGICETLYDTMRRQPEAVPYDMVDGAPVFAAIASPETWAGLWRNDPQLRQDVRFSGAANNNLSKYNFQSTVRGQFLAVPFLWPRRFNYVGGQFVEVLPLINGIPMEVGSFTGLNGAYQTADYEEILFHGMYPFEVFFRTVPSTLGENTSFGPEPAFLNSWQWINPQTIQDPLRRVGYFLTAAKIGIGQQYSDAVWGLLVRRASQRTLATFLPEPICPPTTVTCNNTIPATGCPCPLILSAFPDPTASSATEFLILAAPITPTPVADDDIQFGIDTGGYITGTVVTVSSDAKAVSVTFPVGTDLGVCDHFTNIFCDDTLGCFSDVRRYAVNCTDATRLDLTLANPIKADTAADTVTLYYGNGTTQSATVVSVNMTTGVWVVDIGATAFCDQVGGVIAICVPPGTDATCPACSLCDSPTATQCT